MKTNDPSNWQTRIKQLIKTSLKIISALHVHSNTHKTTYIFIRSTILHLKLSSLNKNKHLPTKNKYRAKKRDNHFNFLSKYLLIYHQTTEIKQNVQLNKSNSPKHSQNKFFLTKKTSTRVTARTHYY